MHIKISTLACLGLWPSHRALQGGQGDKIMLNELDLYRLTLKHNQIRSLLNNEEGYVLFKNLNYTRGGSPVIGGMKTYISFKNAQTIRLNTTKMTFKQVNQETHEVKEYNKLIDNLQRWIDESNSSKFKNVVSDDDSVLLPQIPDYLVDEISEESIDKNT